MWILDMFGYFFVLGVIIGVLCGVVGQNVCYVGVEFNCVVFVVNWVVCGVCCDCEVCFGGFIQC